MDGRTLEAYPIGCAWISSAQTNVDVGGGWVLIIINNMNNNSNVLLISTICYDGLAEGLVKVEIANRTVQILKSPQTKIDEALNHLDKAYTGVYILLGDEGEKREIYIGEAEDIRMRITQHVKDYKWWTSVVFITELGNRLNKAEIKYVESQLINKAKSISKLKTINKKNEKAPSLKEHEQLKIDAFLDDVLTILPFAQVRVFVNDTISDELSALFEFKYKPHNSEQELKATATILDNGKFMVLKGSMFCNSPKESTQKTYSNLHAKMVKDKELKDAKGYKILTINKEFKHPTEATSTIVGYNMKNNEKWKLIENDSKNYEDYIIEKISNLK